MAAVWKLHKELASFVSWFHTVKINTHSATAHSHTVYTHTCTIAAQTWTGVHTLPTTHVPPSVSGGQSEDRVYTVFCKLLASALWRATITVIHLFILRRIQIFSVIISVYLPLFFFFISISSHHHRQLHKKRLNAFLLLLNVLLNHQVVFIYTCVSMHVYNA